MPADPPLSPGQIVAEKYVVEHVLGGGAMGLVVAARHLTLDRHVAIKVLRDGAIVARDEAIACFHAEARAAASIDSDHVCRVFDFGTLPTGEPFMVMEHLEGNDLEVEIERRGQLAISEAVDYVLQAAEAISAAHALGIVHRDLKPANLFLATRPDGTRRVKVLDFGVALPTEGSSLGTPAYMSPEQIRAPRDIDARTDVWALGAILYELLSGQIAFVGDSVHAVLDMVLHDEPCPLDVLRRSVPAELSAIVTRCLARDRGVRFPSVAKLAAALAPFGTFAVVSQLASVQRELGGSLRVPSAPSVQPMVTTARDRDTQPDEEELLARDSIVQAYGELRARRRKAASAVRALAAATLVAAAISVLFHVSTIGRDVAEPRANGSPPPAAQPLPPTAVQNVQGAPISVQSAQDPPRAPPPAGAPSAAPSASTSATILQR